MVRHHGLPEQGLGSGDASVGRAREVIREAIGTIPIKPGADMAGGCDRLIGMTRGDGDLGARIDENLRDAHTDAVAATCDQYRSAPSD